MRKGIHWILQLPLLCENLSLSSLKEVLSFRNVPKMVMNHVAQRPPHRPHTLKGGGCLRLCPECSPQSSESNVTRLTQECSVSGLLWGRSVKSFIKHLLCAMFAPEFIIVNRWHPCSHSPWIGSLASIPHILQSFLKYNLF